MPEQPFYVPRRRPKSPQSEMSYDDLEGTTVSCGICGSGQGIWIIEDGGLYRQRIRKGERRRSSIGRTYSCWKCKNTWTLSRAWVRALLTEDQLTLGQAVGEK